MAKEKEPIERRIDGSVWLARHVRRRDIVSYVRGNRDAPPDWLKNDRVWEKVCRDRTVWKAAHPSVGPERSVREVAELCKHLGITRGTVHHILLTYANPEGPAQRKDTARLNLRTIARKAITREVVSNYYAGRVSATDVAALIGNGADHRNAVYWLGRMRKTYEQADKG